MTFPARCSLWIFCLFAATALVSAAEPTGEAHITRVEATTDVAAVASPVNNLGGTHLTKFVDDVYREPRAVLTVDWRTPHKGLAAGAIVRLEYHRADEEQLRTMDIRYDEPVSGDRTTIFTVSLGADGSRRVSAWRIQVMYRGRVLDEKTSASWR